MLWNRRQIDRRRMLGGLGTLLTLPFLHSLLPRTSLAAQSPIRRLVVWYVPNGFYMPDWLPAGTGTGYSLSPVLAPLAPVREFVSVLTGLGNAPAAAGKDGIHARATASSLVCMPVKETAKSDVYNGISLDQVLAKAKGHLTPVASLQLGLQTGYPVGGCEQGYSCAYINNISWAGPTQPMPKVTSPQALFDQLFAGEDPQQTVADRKRRMVDQLSVLDFVREDIAGLTPRLGVEDRLRLEQFTAGIRDVEKRLVDTANAPVCPHDTRPAPLLDVPGSVDAMSRLITTALACDITRIVTFMFGNGASTRTYPFLGITGNHHALSHHANDATAIASLRAIGAWEVKQFAAFIARLAETKDPWGESLLATTTVLFISEVGEGDVHDMAQLPVILAGSGGGWHTPGRLISFPAKTPVSRLYRTCLESSFGLPPQVFGADGDSVLAALAT